MADQPVETEGINAHAFTVHEGAQTSNVAECAWGMQDSETRVVCGQSRFAKRHAGFGVVVLRDQPLTVVLGVGNAGGGGNNVGSVGGYGGSGSGGVNMSASSFVVKNRDPEFSFTDVIPAVQAWDAFSAQVRDTIIRKSKDYGDAWKRQGYMGNLSRVLSKAARLENMMWRDDESNGIGASEGGESLADTAVDGAALLAFFLTNFEEGNRWGR